MIGRVDTMYYEFNGNVLPQVRLVDKATFESPSRHRWRRIDEYVFFAIRSGVMYLEENGIYYELREGDTILLDPEYPHGGWKSSTCEYFYVHFRHPQFFRRESEEDFLEKCFQKRNDSLKEENWSHDRYQDSWIILPKVIHLKQGPGYLKLMRLLQEARDCNRNQMENYKILCEAKVMEALVEITREAVSAGVFGTIDFIPESYRKVHALLNYLNANYREPITSGELEERFCCNFDYINRIFKKIIGKTIFVYLNEYRIHRACVLLETTSMKISAISSQVGFPDESYFNKVFKKFVGVTPGQYEKQKNQLFKME